MVSRITKEENSGMTTSTSETEDGNRQGHTGDSSMVHAISRDILHLHAQLLSEHDLALQRLALAKEKAKERETAESLPFSLHDLDDVKPQPSSCEKQESADWLFLSTKSVEPTVDCVITNAHVSCDDDGTASDKSAAFIKASKNSSSKEYLESERRARDEAKHLATRLKCRLNEASFGVHATTPHSLHAVGNMTHGVAGALATGWAAFQRKIRRLTEMAAFEACFAVAILANSIAVGIEVNEVLIHPHAGVSASFAPMNYTFSFVFIVELLCRVCAQGRGFFCSSQWSWNYFDLAIVSASVLEVVSEAMGANTLGSGMGGRGARIIRVLRITRFIRILRVARVVRFVRALRQLIHSIVCTLQEVVWAFVLMFIVIYIFAIVFAQAVSGKALETGQVPTGRLQEFWGTVPKSMWVLFMSISGGVNWQEVVEPLQEVWPPLVLVFSFYVTFTVFAMLNVITGVFCESAIAAARTDADHVCQEHLLHKSTYMQSVKNLFTKIGQSGEGITYDDLEEFLSDEMAPGFFAALDIDISDVWTLFKLLDENESRIVNLEEFVAGCFRLKGDARSLDVALMGYEHKQFRRRVFRFMDATETTLQKMYYLQKHSNHGMSSVSSTRSQSSRRISVGDEPSEVQKAGRVSFVLEGGTKVAAVGL
eukprot:TRINITY_DN51254_c0_g1_i2.p1 TRINITY_DN51254_c0_g1~~TRINITY_DN51254_c0_g1_i2.p1  ORF type:complete len:653 (+),score=118.89 TRINITY_DN51254_c0_g1_i2:109-2067(+)